MSHTTPSISQADEVVSILSAEAQRDLGLVAYWAAWVENSLRLVAELWLCSDRETAKLLIKGKSAGWVADTLSAVATTTRVASDPKGARLAVAVGAAREALKERNGVLHSAMGGALEPGHVALFRSSNELTRIMPEAELKRLARSLRDAADGLLALT